MLEITLVKSTIGYKKKAKLTIAALGLKKINQSVLQSDNPQIRGMLNKVDFLVKVTEVSK